MGGKRDEGRGREELREGGVRMSSLFPPKVAKQQQWPHRVQQCPHRLFRVVRGALADEDDDGEYSLAFSPIDVVGCGSHSLGGTESRQRPRLSRGAGAAPRSSEGRAPAPRARLLPSSASLHCGKKKHIIAAIFAVVVTLSCFVFFSVPLPNPPPQLRFPLPLPSDSLPPLSRGRRT